MTGIKSSGYRWDPRTEREFFVEGFILECFVVNSIKLWCMEISRKTKSTEEK